MEGVYKVLDLGKDRYKGIKKLNKTDKNRKEVKPLTSKLNKKEETSH